MTCIWNPDTRQWEGERYQWPQTTRLELRYHEGPFGPNREYARRRTYRTRCDAQRKKGRKS